MRPNRASLANEHPVDAQRKENNENDDQADRQRDRWIGREGHEFSQAVRLCGIAQAEQACARSG